jgi:hypothetical protein
MRKELRASLEDARTRVAELETQVLDSKLEIDSLNASPVVSDEVDCADCSIFLADLALFSGEKPSEQPQSKPKPKLVRFHCGYCGKEGHKDEFCFKRKREERMAKE